MCSSARRGSSSSARRARSRRSSRAAILPLAVAGSADAAELAAMLALLVAACFALAWLLRLGWIADYFSRPVLVGYIHGVAVVLDHRPAREAARSVDRRAGPAAAALGGRARARRVSAAPRSSLGAVALAIAARARPRHAPAPGGARWSSSPRSVSRGRSTCRPMASPSSARFPQACRASTCPAPPGRTSSTSCRRRSASSWSRSPTRS